jgi:Zn-dependent peptidase ImmA (M78 family)/transcriptional regulator with XRE-family HTH domain
MVAVNPEIMRWARKTAGLNADDAASKLGIQDARGLSAAQRLDDIESGVTEPSRPQLLNMSKQYRRPLITFYMAKKPVTADTGQDFRTLPEALDVMDDARASTLLRDVHARQGIIKSVLEEAEEAFGLPFVGSCNIEDGVRKVAESIATLLDFDREEYREQKTTKKSFELLRNKAEAAGVFVLLIGDLGNHHTAIPVDVFRGFAIADNVAPFVVINDKDAESARSFTLLHELAHILLGETGMSNAFGERKIEKFCNDVASDVLTAGVEFSSLGISNDTDFEESVDIIGQFARALKVSSSMIAYKLMLEGHINQATWKRLRNKFRELWLETKKGQKTKRKKNEGPSYYVVRRHRMGNALMALSNRMMQAGMLTTTKAAKVLGVKPSSVQRLLNI